MERVLVIGSPGAGKSTLASQIADRTGLPLIHLDAEYWQPGWIEPANADWRTKVAGIIAGERWVIDGNYGGSMAQRLARADTVVWLDYPTGLCLWRALRRIWRYRGISRPDMAAECPEHFNVEFIAYIATFRATKRREIAQRLADFPGVVRRFASPKATARWLAGLAA